MTASTDSVSHNHSKGTVLLIEFALAMGGFAIGTGEFTIMGLMPNMAQDLAITEPQVGHVISAYALGVVVGAPLLAIIGARFMRRKLLIALMGFFALGNLASALAPGYESLMIYRFIAGLPHGAYFGVAALVAASLVPVNQRAKAVSRVMLGLTFAMLVGNPLATWLGQLMDWRYAFGFVGSIAVLTMLLVFLFLPVNKDEPRSNPIKELKSFNRPQVWLALAIGSIGFAGMFCVFSYLAPTLLEVTKVSKGWIPFALAAFGMGGIVGNLAGGWLFDRLKFKAVGWILIWSTAVLMLYPLASGAIWSMLIASFAIGTMVALATPLQTHLMDIAGDAQTLAAASNHAAFNIANALGPWLGGIAITAGLGWTSTGYVGAAMAVAGLLVFLIAWKQQRGGQQPEESMSVAGEQRA
ncbi:MFS transporter [Marinobacter sp. BGYM27]|uniref:MFS transporter n=1 Tax=Marinobacter sp. BGYM27 TaxID=2975597 RepID=UPI0021A5C301|nr:MFS transporter [Marinobacter sp. BGYM27]MDG5499507.1 MFS transporter [Marinobacter sp. BGYM27]